MESFDEENLTDIFKTQIISNDRYIDIQINHLAPLYIGYKKVMNIKSISDEDAENLKFKFENICMTIIKFICKKYNIEIDTEWLQTNLRNLPAITMCLYQFF